MGGVHCLGLFPKKIGFFLDAFPKASSTVQNVVFSSTAGAAEYQGDFLGEFLERGDYNGRMSCIQRDNVGQKDIFLYYHKQGVWLVGPVLGGTRNRLQNPRDSLAPPQKGWGF